MAPDLPAVVAFLREIGLSVSMQTDVRGFFQHIDVVEGRIILDPACGINDLLHEAGHLAIIPAQYRHVVTGDIDGSFENAIGPLLDANALGGPDDPLPNALKYCDDQTATAWAWAVGKHLGLDEALIISNPDYEGDSAVIRTMLASNEYCGITRLYHAKMCKRRGEGCFPTMLRWVQPIIPVITPQSA